MSGPTMGDQSPDAHPEYGYDGNMYAFPPDACAGGRDFYAILGISRTASNETIRRAYRRKALECHPDRAGDSEEKRQEFFDIQAAYEVLNDEKKRAIFDKYGEDGIGVMDLAGAFSFVLHIDFGFQTFLYMSIILVGVALLLTFSILLALKYDGLISIPWPNVFAPLYVFLIVFVFPCCCAFSLGHHNTKGSPPPSSEHLELDTRENKEHQPGYRKYFYWLIFFSFVAFSILYPLHYEKGFPESWIGSFSPLIITMVALLLLKITSLYKTIEAGPAAEFEDPKNDSGLKLDTHEEGEPGPQKPAKYSVREKIILTLGKYTTPLFTLQIILAAFKLDQYFGDTSWKIIFVPSWAWAVIGLVLVVLESMTPSLYSPGISNGSVKLSNTNIFFIVLVPNLLLLLVNSAFFYPVIVMLQYRLDNPNSAYYQARQILAPIFALFALLMIITIACPIIAVMLRKYLLRKFGKSYSTGNYQRQTTAGLITASSNP